jgi:diketogulonate reductase-like aldo/keto reductase
VAENLDVFGWQLSEQHMQQLAAMDATKGSLGRIMKGDNFAPASYASWHQVWDEGS